jgi:tetratricopeptide (TPR) repeat protein
MVLTTARRYDEAITQLRATMDLDPNFVLTHWRLVGVYSAAGRHNEAIAEAKRSMEIAPNVVWSRWSFGLNSARAGDRSSALKIIEELKQVSPPNNTALMIATIYADLGDKDQAFAW